MTARWRQDWIEIRCPLITNYSYYQMARQCMIRVHHRYWTIIIVNTKLPTIPINQTKTSQQVITIQKLQQAWDSDKYMLTWFFQILVVGSELKLECTYKSWLKFLKMCSSTKFNKQGSQNLTCIHFEIHPTINSCLISARTWMRPMICMLLVSNFSNWI